MYYLKVATESVFVLFKYVTSLSASVGALRRHSTYVDDDWEVMQKTV